MQKNKIKIGLHGEAILMKIDALPEGVKQLPHNGDLIIAPSETLGHHHRVYCGEQEAQLYERDGVLYLNVDSPVSVSCKGKHDTEKLDIGTYYIGAQQEWDYLSQMKRNVAD